MIRRAAVGLGAAASLLLLVASTQATTPRGASFSPDRFDAKRSAMVDNKWMPLRPGMQLVYTGATGVGKRLSRREVFTVTDLTKVLAGVRSVVVWDLDYVAGELVERELVFFAQDRAGNIWHLGEHPEEFENGKFVEAPTWIQGIKGARAGIFLTARPHVGEPAYSQGYAPPPISWTDHAKTLQTGRRTCVPAGCYDDVVVEGEFNPDEPGVYQTKYYAPTVGNVRVGWLGKDPDREVLMLTKVARLRGAALARARRAALRLEQHAYKISKNVYGRTSPATRR